MPCNGQDAQKIARKLVFLDQELRRLSDALDEVRLRDDARRYISDRIVNLELQLSYLRELFHGPQVAS